VDEKAVRRAALITLRRAILQNFPPGPAVASPWHTLGLLLILGVPILSGIHAQRAGGFGAGTVPEGHSPAAILVYLFMIALTWALFGYCALGVRGRGIGALAGGRWTSWKSVGTDLAIMVPSWLILMGANVGVAWLLGARLPPVG
jgi:hypothetical protein